MADHYAGEETPGTPIFIAMDSSLTSGEADEDE